MEVAESSARVSPTKTTNRLPISGFSDVVTQAMSKNQEPSSSSSPTKTTIPLPQRLPAHDNRRPSPSRLSISSDTSITRNPLLNSPGNIATSTLAYMPDIDKSKLKVTASPKTMDTAEITQALQQKLKLKFANRRAIKKDETDEIASLNEIISNPEKSDAVVSAYSNLFQKYEALKIENTQLFQHIDKLKSERSQVSRRISELEVQIDEKADLHESAVIDKCIAEENMDVLKERIRALEDRIEELTLELDLSSKENEGGNDSLTSQYRRLSPITISE
jgi:hypothetical protein